MSSLPLIAFHISAPITKEYLKSPGMTLSTVRTLTQNTVAKSACKDTTLNTYKTIAVTTFLTAQINAAISIQPDLSFHFQSRLLNPNLITDLEN
jgi:16S rRNA A1518/A1519 N6-dimethyltransferase RsmA/KsgA/DIM1 with predicted DNA glycosylase/AP lyase activity